VQVIAGIDAGNPRPFRCPARYKFQANSATQKKKAPFWCLSMARQDGKESNLKPPGYEFEPSYFDLKSQNSAFQLA
jgi:hypothetical protein